MLPSYFLWIGLMVHITGSLVYLTETLKGRIQPNRVSFLVWTLAPFVGFLAQVSKGVESDLLIFTLAMGAIPLSILIATFFNKKAYWKLGNFDFACGALSLVGLLLWYITKEGYVALFFAISADGLALLPTMVKSYRAPASENRIAWAATHIYALTAIFTLTAWRMEDVAYAFYIAISTASVVALLTFSPHKSHKTAT